jgi:hypothetical protein
VVGVELYAREPGRAPQIGALAHRDHFMPGASKMPGEMAVLAREVLVNEEKAHQSGSRIARRR